MVWVCHLVVNEGKCQWNNKEVDLNILNELRSMKVEKYMLYKVKHDLLNRKDMESVHLQRTID